MNTKNDVEVIINGKQYTISGYESSEYLQKIATHINEKYVEFSGDSAYRHLDADMKTILLAINLSDDYYKAQKVIEELQKENEELEKEIFNMKHDMIAMNAQIEEKDAKLTDLEEKKEEAQHSVIRLEAQLKELEGKNQQKTHAYVGNYEKKK